MATQNDRGDVQEIIDRVMDVMRSKPSSHFSSQLYHDEPILTTGRRMASYLPDEYRSMRAVSRWQEGENGSRGRWLSEAEFFYRQGMLMADFEDDCPYHGVFKATCPTYSAMSDRQLRGYFTWRTAVRHGEAMEASPSFALVYVNELLCGIGVSNPLDGYYELLDFSQSKASFGRSVDYLIETKLLDYVVYHGLDPELLCNNKMVVFDRQLLALREARAAAELSLERCGGGKAKRAKKQPLPPLGEKTEHDLCIALDALSTHSITSGRLYQEHAGDVDHVVCATFLRLAEHYDKNRKTRFLSEWFDDPVELPYSMFGSSLFFSPQKHPDATYTLDPIHSYACKNGRWTCTRIRGNRGKTPELGAMMRPIERSMAHAYGVAEQDERTQATGGGQSPYPATPKYLQAIIEREIEGRRAWSDAHAPIKIEIDLSKLSGIRTAADTTREALLIDEERDDIAASGMPDEPEPERRTAASPGCPRETHAAPAGEPPCQTSAAPMPSGRANAGAPYIHDATASQAEATSAPPLPKHEATQASVLDAEQSAFLKALLDNRRAVASTSIDVMVDAINEALFDQLGDTAIEFGPDGPQLIEDYREDVEGLV